MRVRSAIFRATVLLAAGLLLGGCDILMGLIGGGGNEASLEVSPQFLNLQPGGESFVTVTAKNKSGNVENYDAYSFNGAIATAMKIGSSLLKVTAGTTIGGTQIYISSASGMNTQIQVTVAAGGGGGLQAPSLSSGFIDSNNVSLSWNSVGTGTTVYDIERALQSDYAWTRLQSGASSVFYTDATAQPETAYVYRVQARDQGLTSNWSASLSLTTPAVGGGQTSKPYTAPANLRFTTTQYEVQLNWDSVYSAKYYEIERAMAPAVAGETPIFAWVQTVYSILGYLDDNVTSGTSYVYRVRAGNDYGPGPYSGYVYPDTKSGNETAIFPAPAVSYDASYNSIQLYWNPVWTYDGLLRANYYRVTKWNETTYVDDVVADSTTNTYFLDQELVANHTYYYAVTALDEALEEQQWYYLTITTPIDSENNPPADSPILTAQSTGETTSYLYWSEVNGAEAYRVYRDTDYWGTFTALVYEGEGLAVSDSGLTSGAGYYYKVVAYNENGDGPWSDTQYILTSAPTTEPPTPAAPYLGDRYGNEWIRLDWNPAAGATYYGVEWSYDGVNWTDLGTIYSPSFTYTGLASSQTYYFRVRAWNAIGWSGYSDSFSYTAPNWLTIQLN